MKFVAWMSKKYAATKETLQRGWKRSSTFAGRQFSRVEKPLRRYPMISFLVLLAILFAIIAAVNLIHAPEETSDETVDRTKTVQTFSIGQAPRIRVNGQVEKSGVITIVAPAPGVVNSVLVEPGQEIYKGKTVVSLASNYSGGSLPGLQAQIAREQWENMEETYPAQKDIIAKQRELAQKQETQADDLREISASSLNASRDLLELNETQLAAIELSLETATDSAEIEAAMQLKAQLLQGIISLRSQIDQTEYQSNDDNPPAELARLQRDLTLKQLEVQEKSLELNKEVTQLQLRVAQVQAASMYPSAPFNARVERVHVSKGEFVQAGTPLVTIDCDTAVTQVIAKVPGDIAQQVSSMEPSVLLIGSESIELIPDYVSREATDGQLYSVQYTLPLELTDWLTDNSFVSVDLPLGFADTSAVVPFIPIDAVHQNELRATVYVMKDNQATAREVQLGDVQGRFVMIESGLNPGDIVIVDRNVVAGDQVEKL